MKTKSESNSFERMRVIADYNVGDQRIIVLQRSDSVQAAVAGEEAGAPAKPTRKIAARPANASAVGAGGPWLMPARNTSEAGRESRSLPPSTEQNSDDSARRHGRSAVCRKQ
jgi:hypothetical protein